MAALQSWRTHVGLADAVQGRADGMADGTVANFRSNHSTCKQRSHHSSRGGRCLVQLGSTLFCTKLVLDTSVGRRGGKTPRPWKATSPVIAELAASSKDGDIEEIFSVEDFQQRVKAAGDKLIVVDVSTKWCGPCKVIYPTIVAMSKEFPDVVFLKVFGDHDTNTKVLMKEWSVKAVPNFRFFRGGELVHSHNGAKEEDLRNNFLKYYAQKGVAV